MKVVYPQTRIPCDCDVIQSGPPVRARRKFAIGRHGDERAYEILFQIFASVYYVLRVEVAQKILLVMACSVLLTSAAWQKGVRYTSTFDLFVYCTIYCFWLIICLPWLLVNVDLKQITLLVGVLGRLFAADIGALAWSAYNGQTQLLLRGLRLKPMFEPSLSWLAEAGYNVRYGVVVACVLSCLLRVAIEAYYHVPVFTCDDQDDRDEEKLPDDIVPKEYESPPPSDEEQEQGGGGGGADDTRSHSCPSPTPVEVIKPTAVAERAVRPVPMLPAAPPSSSMMVNCHRQYGSDMAKLETCCYGGRAVLGRANTFTFKGRRSTAIRRGARSQDRLPSRHSSDSTKSGVVEGDNSKRGHDHEREKRQMTPCRSRKTVDALDSAEKRREGGTMAKRPIRPRPQRGSSERGGSSISISRAGTTTTSGGGSVKRGLVVGTAADEDEADFTRVESSRRKRPE